LGQIAEAVSLAIDRLTKLEQSETLKHQWEDTFDAILDPVSLMTSDYTLVRINRSFADRSGAQPEEVIGRKCYEALFARTAPCEGCALSQSDGTPDGVAKAKLGINLGANFRLKPSRTSGGENVIYDVFSQEIGFKTEDRSLFVNMYHDLSAQLRLERQILESAKMAELGTIGSSIAHELNNPLGGMLSFLQLIKMDLQSGAIEKSESNATWFDDINEMEKGARRCRDIVQSLLGFTRKSSVDTTETIDLREVIEQALKITELQTRAMGLKLSQEFPGHPVEMRGQFNALAQALRNFLQNAQEAIGERLRNGLKQPGEIRMRLTVENNENVIEILDNGTGFDSGIGEKIYDPMYTTKNPLSNPGLGLTVAQQIIKDHGGRVDIASVQGSGTSAKISFPRPVFDP
jgi:C4-dicarboxylate-specific signal transduction histidine kinase